jgi:dihydroflavonol-4-reductase
VSGELTVVTGVSGFVGSAVARALAARGERLRGVARGSSVATNLTDFPDEMAEADLRDFTSVRSAMEGATTLYHVAADYRVWAPDLEDIVRNNLAMTEAVMRAALEAGVKRVVYTSSVATLLPLDGGASDESRPARPEQATGAYKRSKVLAERLVEKLVAEKGLNAVIVNPSTPIGQCDVKPTPTGRIIVEAANGGMPAYVDSGLNLVHVDDVAQGHLQAAKKGRAGERYILGGQDVPLSAMLAEIARILGKKPPKIELPVAPLFPLAWVAEQWARISGKEPFITLDSLRMAKHHMYYTSAKAERELGYKARPYPQALKDALDWFRVQGMLK